MEEAVTGAHLDARVANAVWDAFFGRAVTPRIGKATLPLIYAIERAPADQAASLRRAIETGGLDSLDNIVSAIRDTGAIARARDLAQVHADKAKAALALLPESEARDALGVLADYALQRDH